VGKVVIKYIRLPGNQGAGYRVIRRSGKKKTRISDPDALMF